MGGDRQTDMFSDKGPEKTTRWGFTAFEGQWCHFVFMPDLVAEWGWQTEICPDTQREHYQGYIRTKHQCRFAQMKKLFPGVHIKWARNWDALINYCKKSDTAVPGTQVHAVSESKALSMSDALIVLASNYPYLEPLPLDKIDLKTLKDRHDTEFWMAVENVLRDTDPHLIGLYHQPQYARCMTNLRKFYLETAVFNAEWGETDRQIDIPNNAFEN